MTYREHRIGQHEYDVVGWLKASAEPVELLKWTDPKSRFLRLRGLSRLRVRHDPRVRSVMLGPAIEFQDREDHDSNRTD